MDVGVVRVQLRREVLGTWGAQRRRQRSGELHGAERRQLAVERRGLQPQETFHLSDEVRVDHGVCCSTYMM